MFCSWISTSHKFSGSAVEKESETFAYNEWPIDLRRSLGADYSIPNNDEVFLEGAIIGFLQRKFVGFKARSTASKNSLLFSRWSYFNNSAAIFRRNFKASSKGLLNLLNLRIICWEIAGPSVLSNIPPFFVFDVISHSLPLTGDYSWRWTDKVKDKDA